MKRKFWAASTMLTVLMASPAVAQDVQPCELHIWPAERMTSITTGLLGGGLLDAALHSGTDANNKASLATALDSPSQLDALQSLDLASLETTRSTCLRSASCPSCGSLVTDGRLELPWA